MARESGGLCTTRCQLFNSEIIKKENTLRIKWFIKNRQRLLDNLRDDKLVKRAKELRNKSAEERLNKQQESLKEVSKIIFDWIVDRFLIICIEFFRSKRKSRCQYGDHEKKTAP